MNGSRNRHTVMFFINTLLCKQTLPLASNNKHPKDMEKPICLIPEIFEHNYTPDSEVFTLIYDLPRPIANISFNGTLLALAHDSGVSILTPIPQIAPLAKNLPSDLQQHWVFQMSNVLTKSPVILMQFTSKYLVMALTNGQLVLMNHLDGSQLSLSHQSDINGLDVNEQGCVVIIDDDSKLIIWEHGKIINTIQFNQPPTLVKFWNDKDSDKIVIVESGKSIKLYNWRQDKFGPTIYPIPYNSNAKPFIKDVIIINGNLTVIGDGWWKEYDLDQLSGGVGLTSPFNQGSLTGWLSNSKYIASTTSPLIGSIAHDRSCFYDLTSKQGQQFKLSLPCVNVSCGAINHQGVVAFVSGAKLILTKPFDSYEAVQY